MPKFDSRLFRSLDSLRVGVFKWSLDNRGTYEAMHGGKKEKQEEQIARSRSVIGGECGPRACDGGAVEVLKHTGPGGRNGAHTLKHSQVL